MLVKVVRMDDGCSLVPRHVCLCLLPFPLCTTTVGHNVAMVKKFAFASRQNTKGTLRKNSHVAAGAVLTDGGSILPQTSSHVALSERVSVILFLEVEDPM